MIVAIDFETFYTKEYSLTKMSEAEYILDPRFETIMCAIKIDTGPSCVFVGHNNINQALSRIDWDNVALLAHNTRFDGSILAWHFGYVPKLYLDTLSMARATTHWDTGASSLKSISKFLDLPPKGDAVMRAIGKRLSDFTPDELDEYKCYCSRDNDNAWEIFNRLRSKFTARELQLIDLVLRMFILPQVQLDSDKLDDHLIEVRAEKARALAQVNDLLLEDPDDPFDNMEWTPIERAPFASNQQFAELLYRFGVDVPMKRSPTTGQMIPAIAKNDWEFKELCADTEQPPVVQALLAARLSVKSTIDETRAESLLKLSRLSWPPGKTTGWAPVPLKYSGARTHRLSGDGGTNWQNLRRGSFLRSAVRAPLGYRVVHRDASQIEARMVAWLSGCEVLLDAFAEGRDVYSEFASIIYERKITREDKIPRFIGKTAILGLGYGCGHGKFRHMLFIGSSGLSYKIDPIVSETIVNRYRQEYQEVTWLWRACELLLEHMLDDGSSESKRAIHRLSRNNYKNIMEGMPIQYGPDAIWLPNELCIAYPNLRHYRSADNDGVENGDEDNGICYDSPYGHPTKLYGAKVTENISQALARIIVTDIALRVYNTTGFYPWLSCHDSLSYCVPEDQAEAMDAELAREFGHVPEWAEGLPLASEGGFGASLLDAERQVNQ